MSTLSSANVTDVNLVLKERTHMRLCLNMLISRIILGNWLITEMLWICWLEMENMIGCTIPIAWLLRQYGTALVRSGMWWECRELSAELVVWCRPFELLNTQSWWNVPVLSCGDCWRRDAMWEECRPDWCEGVANRSQISDVVRSESCGWLWQMVRQSVQSTPADQPLTGSCSPPCAKT